MTKRQPNAIPPGTKRPSPPPSPPRVPSSSGLSRGSAEPAQSKALQDVIAERQRQQAVEGWTPEHDDQHVDGSLAMVAALYAMPDKDDLGLWTPGWPAGESERPNLWPSTWAAHWWKPTDRRRNLVKAMALGIAEIERLDRAASKGKSDV